MPITVRLSGCDARFAVRAAIQRKLRCRRARSDLQKVDRVQVVTPNDKLATYGVDDPEVEGVAPHPHSRGARWPDRLDRGGGRGLGYLAGLPPGRANSLKKKFAQGEDMFRHRRALFFKKMQIVRGCDVKRNVLVYMMYSDKLIEGSPKNST